MDWNNQIDCQTNKPPPPTIRNSNISSSSSNNSVQLTSQPT